MEVVEEPNENEDLNEEEEEEDATLSIQNRKHVTVANMAAVREESKNDMPDDTTNHDNIAMSTVNIDKDSENSDNSDYEYTEQGDVHDDGDYVVDEDASYLSYT
eukprot:3624493-Ditylum_brightwellii.AAC.1